MDLGGNDATNAFSLTLTEGKAIAQDWIGLNGDSRDYYRFNLEQSGTFSVTLSGLSDNVNMQLFNEQGQRVGASYTGGTQDDVISGTFQAGSYYVALFGKTPDVQTSYSLNIQGPASLPAPIAPVSPATTTEPTSTPTATPTATPTSTPQSTLNPSLDGAGDGFDTARLLTWDRGQAIAQDWIGVNGDLKDYYRFAIAQTGDVMVTLSGLSDNANLQLFNNQGQRIGASYAGGTQNDVIASKLAAGDYYAVVFGKTTDVETAYTLTLKGPTAEPTPLAPASVDPTSIEPEPSEPDPLPSPNPNIDLAGDTFGTAHQLDLSQGSATVQDWIGLNGDLRDYYSFDVAKAGEVTITLSGLSDNVNLQLFDGQGQRIAASYAGGTQNDVIAQTLAEGTYSVMLFGKTSDVETAYTLSVLAPVADATDPTTAPESTPIVPQPTPIPEPISEPISEPIPEPVLDWFSNNLQDAELKSMARDRFQDGKIDRNDMIALLQSAGDANVVDSAEFADLKTLVSSAAYLNLDGYVVNLSNKLVNGDRANQWYTGGATQRTDLGNLQAGSSADQLNKLIGKWFLGSDRPTTLSTSHQYTYVQGQLFQNGIQLEDIVQSQLGDCYLMVVLAGTAQKHANVIQDMFIDNGDGTFTVRFFKNGVADYVTVDRYLSSINGTGKSPYTQFGSSPTNSSNELWGALLEKAYAQLNESGWVGQDNTNSYAGIEGGWMSMPTSQVLGVRSRSVAITSSSISKASMIDLVNSQQVVTVGIVGAGQYGAVDNHAYTLKGYDAVTQTFQLHNPWGTKHISLTWEQLQSMGTNFVWSELA